jgi:hypothetical protein
MLREKAPSEDNPKGRDDTRKPDRDQRNHAPGYHDKHSKKRRRVQDMAQLFAVVE